MQLLEAHIQAQSPHPQPLLVIAMYFQALSRQALSYLYTDAYITAV